jgi:hypothetical protein
MAKVTTMPHHFPADFYEDVHGERCQVRIRRLIDLARAEPVMVAKHDRPLVVVMAVEEYDRIVGSTKKGPLPAKTPGRRGVAS